MVCISLCFETDVKGSAKCMTQTCLLSLGITPGKKERTQAPSQAKYTENKKKTPHTIQNVYSFEQVRF